MDSGSALLQDSLTGLPTVQGWTASILGGMAPVEGAIIALDITGVGGVTQTYGRDSADTLLKEVVARTQQALPRDAVFIRGSGNTFFIWLPGLNGVDLLRRLNKQLKNLRVLVFSGHENPVLVREMLEAGAHGFVEKTAGLVEFKKGLEGKPEDEALKTSEPVKKLDDQPVKS